MNRLFFPLSFLLAVVGAALGLRLGVAPSAIPTIVTIAALVVVIAAEALAPRVQRAAEAGEVHADVGFATVTAIVDSLAQAALAAVVVATAAVLPQDMLSEISLWLGVPLALLVSGLGDYWAHRWSHEWSWWWKLHAVHHAPHRMVALNNFRLHPLDLVLKLIATMGPLLLLGFSLEVLAMVGAIRGLTVAFQHANLDLRHGALNYLIATNSVHRWHHSAEIVEGNANYGGILIVYDLLFRSYRVPSEELEPARMGLYKEEHYPVHRVLRSTVAPLCWRGCVETEG